MAWIERFPVPSRIRTISTLIAFILALPVSWKGLTGIYNWLSPYLMLNSVLALRSFVILNLAGAIVLLIVVIRKRWFCSHLCPVGWCCDKVSGPGRRKTCRCNKLPEIGKWIAVISLGASVTGFPLLAILDPLAVFNGFFTVFQGNLSFPGFLWIIVFPLIIILSFFFPGIWCLKLCPLGGLQLLAHDLKCSIGRLIPSGKEVPAEGDRGRRYFIMSGIGLLAGAAIPRIIKPETVSVLRPPASVNQNLFSSLCCRCGSCIKACPTGILYAHTDPDYLISWMTPTISYKGGYCLESCNLCGTVCPTGSITLFSTGAKSHIFIGTAKLQLDNCLILNNKECVKCNESCKYHAIRFAADGSILHVVPVIDRDKCVGCGACEVACPAACIRIVKAGKI